MRVLKLSLGMIFNPVVTLRTIQYGRGKLKAYPVFILLALIPIIRVLVIFGTHYPLRSVNPENADFAVEIVTYLVPVVAFVVANFCITSLVNGETLLSEALISGAFSMMPYLLFSIPLMALSHVMSLTEGGIFGSLQSILILWCVILMFVSVKETNDFTFAKTFFVFILIALSILLILAIVLLVYALFNQLITFLTGLYGEIMFNFRYR